MSRSIAFAIAVTATAFLGIAQAAPRIPLRDGNYAFEVRDAEFPDRKGPRVLVRIHGRHVVVIGRLPSEPERGVIDEGTIRWHSRARIWIISDSPADLRNDDVGGCSGGPEEIDFRHRIVWTC